MQSVVIAINHSGTYLNQTKLDLTPATVLNWLDVTDPKGKVTNYQHSTGERV